MTQYDKKFTLPMVILPESMENLLANCSPRLTCAICASRRQRNTRT